MTAEEVYDVCVAGGGFAGVGAAVKAARLGLKTLLVEKKAFLGGIALEARHESLCGLYASGVPDPKVLNTGLCEELERMLLLSGAQKRSVGKVTVLDYAPKQLQTILENLIQKEKNLQVLYEASVEAVEVKNQKIKAITLRHHGKSISLHPAAVVDCTGSGEVIRLSGASYERTPASLRPLAAYAFSVEGVKDPREVDGLKMAYCLAKAAEEQVLETHLRFTVWLPEQSVLRMSVLPPGSAYDIRAIQRQAQRVHQILKDALPEFKNSQIGIMPDAVVEREGLRLCGWETLTEENVLKAEKGREGSVKSGWPMEFWDQKKGPRYQYLSDGAFYEIPDGCYQSKNISNLFAAGKCISADSKALSSARMTGTCLAMGEKSAELVNAFLKVPINIAERIKKENEGNGNETAIRQGARRVSYRQLFDAVEELAGQLKPSVKKYARTGILVREGADYIALNLAALSLGAVIVPIPEISSREEIEHMIHSMKLDVLIFDAAFHETAGKTETLADPFENSSWKIAVFKPAMEQQAEFEALNPAFIRFTSGTTGESKGVVLSHETILARTDAADQVLQISRHDRILWVLSMSFHFIVTILLFLRRGACVVLCGHEIPKGMMEGLSAGDITFIYAAPVQYQMMRGEEFDPSQFTKVRMAVATAMPLGPELAAEFVQKFGFQLTSAYGIIEAGLPFINLSEDTEHRQSVGTVVPGYEFRLTEKDASGAGRVQLKGPGLFDAYFSPWRKKETVLRDGWFDTDDLGREDKGFLFLLGRKRRVINFMGMKIFPEEIEAGLLEYPGIQEAFVDGEPHSLYGQVPRARIVPKPSPEKINEEDLRRFCYRRFSRHKVPKTFEYVLSLKKTASGKIMADQTV